MQQAVDGYVIAPVDFSQVLRNDILCGARGGRTLTVSLPTDFKSVASADSAIAPVDIFYLKFGGCFAYSSYSLPLHYSDPLFFKLHFGIK